MNDDAVFCTAEKTYAIRSITLSNTFCILSPPREGECGDLLIRDNAQQMLEITPSMPKLYRLTSLLKGNELHDNEECEGARGLNEKVIPYIQALHDCITNLPINKLRACRMLNLKFKQAIESLKWV